AFETERSEPDVYCGAGEHPRRLLTYGTRDRVRRLNTDHALDQLGQRRCDEVYHLLACPGNSEPELQQRPDRKDRGNELFDFGDGWLRTGVLTELCGQSGARIVELGHRIGTLLVVVWLVEFLIGAFGIAGEVQAEQL